MSILESIGEIGKADKIYIKPRIPRDKARNAILSYAENLDYDDIVVLIDDTVFGNSKNGLIVTEEAIIGKESFTDPFYFSLSKKPDVFAKKGFTSVTLYINDQKVISFTQPSFNDLISIFRKIDRHIRIAAVSQPHSAQEALPSIAASAQPILESQVADNGVVVGQETEAQPIENSQIIREAVVPDELALPSKNDAPIESIFERIEKDTMIGSIRTMRTVNSAFNFLGDILSDKTTSSEQIRRETSSYFAKTIIKIRADYIERNKVIGLMNNVATLESLIFASGLLHLELSNRGMKASSIGYILNEGIKNFLSLDNSRESNSTVVSLVAIAAKMSSSQEELFSLFYLRQVMSNSRRELCDDKMGMDMLRAAASQQSEQSFEDALHESFMVAIAQSIEEIGDITSDRTIVYNAKKCADVIIDSAQTGWR